MKRRNLARIGASILAITTLAGCGGINPPGKSYVDKNGNTIYTYNFNMYVQDGTTYPETHDNDFDKFIYDNFGIEFNYDRIQRTDWETKTNTYFATNDAPDITTGGKAVNYSGWANQDMLTPIVSSYDELCKKLPNYVKMFEDQGVDMKEVYNLAASGNGKLYYLPSVRQERAQMCWLYREDIFKECGIEKFPSTTDEFLDVCAAIKAKYPDKIIISSNGQKKSSLTGFFQAYGMPELILSKYSYYDKATGEFVPYAMTTDSAREMFIFLKTLVDNNYIDKEILSMEKQDFSTRCYNNNAMITYNYVYNAKDFTSKSQNKDDESTKSRKWVSTDVMLTNDTERGTVYKKDPLYSDWGPAFSVSCELNGNKPDKEKLERVLKYYDYASTKEGAIMHTYGTEGKSFRFVPGIISEDHKEWGKRVDADGKELTTEKFDPKDKKKNDVVVRFGIKDNDGSFTPVKDYKVYASEDMGVYRDAEGNIYDDKAAADAAGAADAQFVVPVVNVEDGWYDQKYNSKSEKKISSELGIASTFIKQPMKFWEDRGSQIEDLYQAFSEKSDPNSDKYEKYYSIDDVPMRYTSDEENQYTDLAGALATKRDEYIARFLIGGMDPRKDSDWNKYISDMERVGLRKFEKLQNTVYNRTQAEIAKENNQ